MAIYRLLRDDVSFDPEEIKVMHLAYEEVCKKLEISKKMDDRLTEIVAIKIIEAAKAGVRNPNVLRDMALEMLGIPRRD